MAGTSRRIRSLMLLAVLVSCAASVLLAYVGLSFAPSETPIAAEVSEKAVVVEGRTRRQVSPTRFTPPLAPLPSIDPCTPLTNLLPVSPKANVAPVYLGNDLGHVPELKFEAAPAEDLTTEQWISRKAHAAAAALHLNAREEDGFLKALVRSRPDLSGLPFLMGDACRTKGDRAKAFKDVAETRQNREKVRHESSRHRQAHVALLAQVLPAEESANQVVLVLELNEIREAAATRELARVAVFSPDSRVRAEAIKALATRPPQDCTDVLVAGLRYPWSAVAENAASAIVRLSRNDLVPELESVLDQPDPRGPRAEVAGGQQVMVAHELVRINHHRNCLLCHAPAEQGKTQAETLVAEVPVPTVPLAKGYGEDSRVALSELLVRIDMTYLRQDFSAVQQVFDTSAWRVMQRFDFVVRKRVLTSAEAADLRTRLAGPSPYRRAVALALRELTGRDYGAKAHP